MMHFRCNLKEQKKDEQKIAGVTEMLIPLRTSLAIMSAKITPPPLPACRLLKGFPLILCSGSQEGSGELPQEP